MSPGKRGIIPYSSSAGVASRSSRGEVRKETELAAGPLTNRHNELSGRSSSADGTVHSGVCLEVICRCPLRLDAE